MIFLRICYSELNQSQSHRKPTWCPVLPGRNRWFMSNISQFYIGDVAGVPHISAQFPLPVYAMVLYPIEYLFIHNKCSRNCFYCNAQISNECSCSILWHDVRWQILSKMHLQNTKLVLTMHASRTSARCIVVLMRIVNTHEINKTIK